MIFLFPFNDFRALLEGMHTNTREDGRTYWHVHYAADVVTMKPGLGGQAFLGKAGLQAHGPEDTAEVVAVRG